MGLSVTLASWRWTRTACLNGFLALALVALTLGALSASKVTGQGAIGAQAPYAQPHSQALAQVAQRHPARQVEVIVQLRQGTDHAAGRALIHAAGGKITHDLHIINGFGAELNAKDAVRLENEPGVRAVSLNAPVEKSGTVDPGRLATAFNQSVRSEKAWNAGYTGKGVGVAVIDTGIAGDLPDFRVSQTNRTSRVGVSAVVSPSATQPGDGFGHGTHVAGLVAGNGTDRDPGDPLYGKYAGVAPDASLISVKAGDEDGGATVLDVIDGLQFVVDFRKDYAIRVVNLSLRSTEAQSYTTDPLDAAVEAAWFKGIVVVVAAGNLGTASDAVSYAPANDPYVISVGGVDDRGTKDTSDDTLADWSSRGTTQDGFRKPEVVAPGAHIVSTLAPGSDYASLCPSCIVDGAYFKVGGTSMAAGIVSGAVTDIVQAHPDWSPNQIKGTLVKRSRGVYETTSSSGTTVDSSGEVATTSSTSGTSSTSSTTLVGREIALDKVLNQSYPEAPANQNLTPNTYVDPTTGEIDYSRASWSRASWSDAVDPLRASWSRASWSRASWSADGWTATPQSCADLERASWSRASWSDAQIQAAKDACTAMDPTRASWSRASWSRASWSTSFDK